MANDQDNLNISIGADSAGIEGGSARAAAAIKKVNAEAEGLDKAFKKLRSSIDPMFAAQTKYNESLAQFDRLLSEGRISEAEYAASIDTATAAINRQAAAQLKGTAVANEAAAATRAAANAKSKSESAANDAILAGSKLVATRKAAQEAQVTASEAREAKARTAIALEEAKARLAAALQAQNNIPSINRDAKGRFISAQTVAADRAAAVEEAQLAQNIAQVEDTAAGQRVRNTTRVATTREEAARRAEVAERAAAEAAVTAAAQAEEADTLAATATEALSLARDKATQSALTAAAAQAEADRMMAAATAAKAKAAADAVLAEEAAAVAAAKAKEADAAAAVEARKLEQAQRAAALAESQRAASANRLKAALDPAFAAQQRYNAAVKLAEDLASTGHIDEPTRLKAVSAAEDALTEALKRGTGAHINNRVATEGLVMAHEALGHRWTRMSGSAMILAQAIMGQAQSASILSAVLSPMGLAVAGVTVALGSFAIAAYKGSLEQAQLQRSLEVTGHYAGMTSAQLDAAAIKIASSTKTSSGQATESLAILTASGRATGQTLITMGEITSRLAELTGQKSTEIAADMVKMADDPTAAMRKLNEQYHFLNPTQVEHIQNLVEQGNKTEAVAELAGSFNAALKSEQTQLTGLAGWAHSAAVAIGDLWQSMKNVGKAEDPVKRLADINAMLAADHPGRGGHQLEVRDNGRMGHYSEREQLEKEAAAIKAKLDSDSQKAHKAVLDQQAQDDADALDKLEMTTKTAHAKMLREQQAWVIEAKRIVAPGSHNSDKQKEDAQYRLDHPDETNAFIARKYDRADTPAKSPKGARGPSDTSIWDAELKKTLEDSKNYFKDQNEVELQFWQTKLAQTTRGSKEYVAIQEKIFPLLKLQARQSYQEQVDALKAKVSDAEGDLEEEGKAWQAYLDKVKSVMGDTSKEYKAATKEYEEYQKKLAEAQVKSISGAAKVEEAKRNEVEEDQKTQSDLSKGNVDYQQSSGVISAKKAAEEKRALLQQEIDDQIAFENTINDIKQKALNKELQVPNLSRDKIADIQAQIEELTATHELKLAEIRNKGLVDLQKANQSVASAIAEKWVATTDAITSSLDSSIKSGIKNGINLKGAMISMADSIINTWVDMGVKLLNSLIRSLFAQKAMTTATTTAMTATHTAGEIAKTGATVAGTEARVVATASGAAQERSINLLTTLKTIGAHAAKAAAGAYAAMASIPIVGPILGAAAAATTFAAVLAFGALVSARGGQAQVPYDGQVTELHKDEMVLPAKFATPLRQQLLSPRTSDTLFQKASDTPQRANSESPWTSSSSPQPSGGDAHLHLHGDLIHSPTQLRQWFERNKSAVASGIRQHVKNNGR